MPHASTKPSVMLNNIALSLLFVQQRNKLPAALVLALRIRANAWGRVGRTCLPNRGRSVNGLYCPIVARNRGPKRVRKSGNRHVARNHWSNHTSTRFWPVKWLGVIYQPLTFL